MQFLDLLTVFQEIESCSCVLNNSEQCNNCVFIGKVFLCNFSRIIVDCVKNRPTKLCLE
jgi:hypothetical protein